MSILPRKKLFSSNFHILIVDQKSTTYPNKGSGFGETD